MLLNFHPQTSKLEFGREDIVSTNSPFNIHTLLVHLRRLKIMFLVPLLRVYQIFSQYKFSEMGTSRKYEKYFLIAGSLYSYHLFALCA